MITTQALNLLELASLSVLCGTWLKLTLTAMFHVPWTWQQGTAITALVLMTTSAATMLVDAAMGVYVPQVDDRWLHGSLALWNALILFNVIRGTAYSVRSPKSTKGVSDGKP